MDAFSVPQKVFSSPALSNPGAGVWGWWSQICAVEGALMNTPLSLWQLRAGAGAGQECAVLALPARAFHLFC